jgi:hypothetical protein
MRIHFGPPPVDQDFQPEAEGWTALKEPSPIMLNVIATPVGLAIGAILIAGWAIVQPQVQLDGSSGERQNGPFILVAAVAGLVALIVVHELLHAITYPRFGLTKDVLIGVWPSKLLCYAVSLGVVGRSRLLVVYVMPFFVLSVLPLVVCLLLRLNPTAVGMVAIVSVVNGMLAGGDITIVGIILWQVPANAVLKNKGWATWWKQRSGELHAASRRFS